ncbi:MAG: methylcrotonoyl-CoA carboxylase, partial [Rhodothermales bacterium]|nr:methylcrotonoyl-CoA carboxylase [Rhodothermales bacterium]
VQAATGEVVSDEELGGADVHCRISGVADHYARDDRHALQIARNAVSRLNRGKPAQPEMREPVAPAYDAKELYGLVPTDKRQPFDMRGIIARIVDGSDFDEFKALYGTTLVCGFAHLNGCPVGIIASNGILFGESALKGTHFVELCCKRRIPLLFLQNITGFMVGKKAESAGIVKHGAKLVTAVANAQVPKLTVIIGNSYGAGNYAMCGRAYDPRLMLAWPTARIAVMGGSQAAKTLLQIQMAKLRRTGDEPDAETQQELLERITARYDAQTSPYYAASRMWVDEIIDPRMTRRWLAAGIEMADHNPDLPPFNPGVIQT